MTRVTIRADCIEITGHAPQAVVCHGVSAASQMASNYLEKRNLAEVRRDEGYIEIKHNVAYDHPVVVALVEALQDISIEYPGNIELICE